MKRQLLSLLGDEAYAVIEGTTDSEVSASMLGEGCVLVRGRARDPAQLRPSRDFGAALRGGRGVPGKSSCTVSARGETGRNARLIAHGQGQGAVRRIVHHM